MSHYFNRSLITAGLIELKTIIYNSRVFKIFKQKMTHWT